MQIKIRNDPSKIKLSPEEILIKAINELNSDLDDLKKLFNSKYNKFHNEKLKNK